MWPVVQPRGAGVRPSVAAAMDSQWMVLRSIDESEAAVLMSEGDALSFAESDAWRPQREPVALLPRPVWRGEGDAAAAPDAAALDAAAPGGQGVAVVPVPMQLCNVLDVVAQALLPVQKLCEAVGVELVMLSSVLMAHMDGVMGRRTGGAARAREADGMLMRVSDADCAQRAISHVLDSAMQRVAQRGRMLVDVARDGGDSGATARVRVTIADTGTAAWADSWEAGAEPPAQSAQEAMRRLEQGRPVSSGEMALWIAERFVRESGGSLSVGRWSNAGAEYVRTVITFRGVRGGTEGGLEGGA